MEVESSWYVRDATGEPGLCAVPPKSRRLVHLEAVTFADIRLTPLA
jgi:hypothetical protein